MTKFFKIAGIVLLILALTLFGMMWYINSASGQRFVQKQLTNYLGNKIDTPFSIGKIGYSIPDWVIVEDLYLEDELKDTLVQAGEIRVDMDMWALISGKVMINSIQVADANIKLYTPEGSENFNYQFLIDAFSSGDTTAVTPASSSTNNFNLDEASLSNTRFYYFDRPGGIEFRTKVGEGNVLFNELNLNENRYDMAAVEVDDGKAYFRSFPGTRQSQQEEGQPIYLNVDLAKLKQFDWHYEGQDIGVDNRVLAKEATVTFEKIDLNTKEIAVEQADLRECDIEVAMFPPQQAQTASDDSSSSGKIMLASLDLQGSKVHYIDKLAEPVLKPGEFNASDFTLSEANVSLQNFLYDGNRITGKVSDAEMKERSGLALEDVSGTFLYTDQLISLQDFRFRTPGSNMDFDLGLSYASLDAFLEQPLLAKMNVEVRKGQIALSDMFRLNAGLRENSGLAKNEKEHLSLNGALKANNGEFFFDNLKMQIGDENQLEMHGFIGGVDNLEKLRARLEIEKLQTRRSFYQSFIPETVDLSGYELPGEISLTGTVEGNQKLLKLNGTLVSDLGEITLIGNLENAASDSLRSYDGYLKTTQLALNKFFGEEMGLGSLSAELNLDANADLSELSAEGTISQLDYQNYSYQDIQLDAVVKDSVLTLNGNSKDKAAKMVANFSSDLKSGSLSFDGSVDISRLNLSELKLSDLQQDMIGLFQLDLKLDQSEYLVGEADLSGFKLGKASAVDFNMDFSREGSTQKANVRSALLNADLASDRGVLGIGDYLSSLMEDSLRLGASDDKIDLTLKGKLLWHPLWSELVPELRFSEPIAFDLMSVRDGLEGHLNFAEMNYGTTELVRFKADLNTKGKDLEVLAAIDQINLPGYRLLNNELNLSYQEEIAHLAYQSEDSTDALLHELAFRLDNSREDAYLQIEKLTFEKQTFDISENNIQIVEGNSLFTRPVTFTSGDQRIILSGNQEQIKLETENLQIAPFYKIFNGAPVDVEGLLQSDIKLANDFSVISGSADVSLKDLMVDKELIGTVDLQMPRFTPEKLTLDGKVSGPRSKASFGGDVLLTGDGKLNLRINLDKLDAALIKAFSYGQVNQASGEVFGELTLTETFSKPRPNGSVGFRDFEVTPTYLGVPLHIDNQKVLFDNRSIIFKEFKVLDSLDQALVFDGNLNWSNLDAISYRLNLKTNNFLLLDTKSADNDLVYGQLKLDADLRLAGVGEKPNVDGKVRIRKGSDLTVVMPTELQTAESQGIVYFVPPDDSLNTSTVTVPRDTLNGAEAFAEVINEILVAVETDEEAKFTIIVDEMNGDQLVFSGTSNLTYGLYPNGQQYLIGSFDLTKGSYSFSLEVFKREFRVLKGSKITWNGDPYKANMDITAAYEVSTDIQSLNAFGLNTSSYGKVPINVLLKLTGSIDEPEVNFDLEVSDKAENSVKSLIKSYDVFSSLRQNTSEMNQQVFSLILFNRFMSDQLLSFSGGGLSGEAVARQSVSKLLTEQLNVLAGNVLGNVGLNLGLNSDVLQGSQGQATRTEFNVGLNRSFLNNRIRVSLGKNFELANSTGLNQNSTEVLDNIDIEYLVTPDGRYVVKIYRDNEYQTVLEGFVVETGVGFELRANYDKFSEIFKKRGTK